MRHTRDEVIQRTIREFRQLDRLVAKLSAKDWRRLVPRPETKERWTVKDALVHITYWKANTVRVINRQPQPPELRGLGINAGNHLIYVRWRRRSPKDVLAWHRQVQKDVLAALKAAPPKYFSGKAVGPDWPYDLDGHSSHHRINDIKGALAGRKA
jgi:Mycothiol maleylpyruvate isomerase N-terminal domain